MFDKLKGLLFVEDENKKPGETPEVQKATKLEPNKPWPGPPAEVMETSEIFDDFIKVVDSLKSVIADPNQRFQAAIAMMATKNVDAGMLLAEVDSVTAKNTARLQGMIDSENNKFQTVLQQNEASIQTQQDRILELKTRIEALQKDIEDAETRITGYSDSTKTETEKHNGVIETYSTEFESMKSQMEELKNKIKIAGGKNNG